MPIEYEKEATMETDTMGRVVVPAKIENVVDLYNAEVGLIRSDQIHRLEVQDALVDTGMTYLGMPRRMIEQLGFTKPFTTQSATTTRGAVVSNIYGPVRLTVQGRFCSADVAEIDDNCRVLIGQVPLELLDWVVDPKGQKLIGNPAHGGVHMFEMY
jgi:predicted aspartyl protease